MAAEAAVGFVVETFGNLLIEEAKFLAGVSDQVEELKGELDWLRSFLRDAEARQDEKREIPVWISQSRDLAYEAEDLLEEYAFRIASQRDNVLRRTVRFLKQCYVRRFIGSEIQKLKSKIDRLTTSFKNYGISSFGMEGEGASSSSRQQLRRTYSHVVEDDFIKVDDDVEVLVGHLVNKNEADLHGVVSISGMGGLGKTTLARKVYNHPKVKGYFENLAWVCISQQWEKSEILRGILIKFLPWKREEIMKWRDEELIRELFLIFRNKECLVVLDDIWSIDAWESIKEAFPIAKKGSKLLLTTRIKGVALHIGPNGFHHELRLLSDMESWELLQIKALRERTYIGDEEMQQMKVLGKEMVKHCGGLPLAVVVLGGILATKRDIEEWKIVKKNVKGHIGRGKNIAQQQGEVEKILALSYNDLPLELKPCFLYLGRFPEDSDIEVERLYQLWMAEGMISVKDQGGEESMMDVAKRYLGELAERSMVQVKINESVLGRVNYCRLHDLMRDLSLEKAKEENFFSIVHSRNGFDDQVYKSSSSTDQIHRLVIYFQRGDVGKYVIPGRKTAKHLRSLRLFVEDYVDTLAATLMESQFSRFRMLRVLEIKFLGAFDQGCNSQPSDCKDSGCLEGICDLIHLRYMSLEGFLFLYLPSSLGNLKCLQTINLRYTSNLGIPNVLWKMRQLKYLYLPLLMEDKLQMENKLQLDGLEKLEILEGFDSRYCSCRDLLKLTNLRRLQANINYDDIGEIVMFISKLVSLLQVELYIIFRENGSLVTPELNESAVIIKLFTCRKLTTLFMENPIKKLPKYEAGFALDLVSLNLELSKIEDDPMATLERLPNLKYLRFGGESFLGTEMECRAGGFPQLRDIQLLDLPNLEKWIIAEGAMPNLSSILIYSCRKLEMIPDGLRFITCLKKLRVIEMPGEFNRRLQVIDGQEGEDFFKIRHLPLVKVRV